MAEEWRRRWKKPAQKAAASYISWAAVSSAHRDRTLCTQLNRILASFQKLSTAFYCTSVGTSLANIHAAPTRTECSSSNIGTQYTHTRTHTDRHIVAGAVESASFSRSIDVLVSNPNGPHCGSGCVVCALVHFTLAPKPSYHTLAHLHHHHFPIAQRMYRRETKKTNDYYY